MRTQDMLPGMGGVDELVREGDGNVRIPALSVWQPWASLIVAGLKEYETRHWLTKYRGRLAIHATLGTDREPQAECREKWPFPGLLGQMGYEDLGQLPTGAVVGVVRLVEIRPGVMVWDELGPVERALGNFGMHRWAWRLEDPVQFAAPIPARGGQGLWMWDWDPLPNPPPFDGGGGD